MNIASPQHPAPPSEDKRWKLVEATMRRYGYQPHALIEALHTVQEAFGYIDETALKFAAVSLRVPLSRAFGVATFYHFFTMKPPGKHTCVICMGTACYIKGAQAILTGIEKAIGLKPGETTPDQKVSLLTARCVGSCGLAPAAVLDSAVAGKMTPDQTIQKMRGWLEHDA